MQATKSTHGAVSVGNPANGTYRQITGVAAGTADSDAANVAQIKASASAHAASAVNYATNPDGSVNCNRVTLGNGQAAEGTRLSNVAPAVQGTDAVNLNHSRAECKGPSNTPMAARHNCRATSTTSRRQPMPAWPRR